MQIHAANTDTLDEVVALLTSQFKEHGTALALDELAWLDELFVIPEHRGGGASVERSVGEPWTSPGTGDAERWSRKSTPSMRGRSICIDAKASLPFPSTMDETPPLAVRQALAVLARCAPIDAWTTTEVRSILGHHRKNDYRRWVRSQVRSRRRSLMLRADAKFSARATNARPHAQGNGGIKLRGGTMRSALYYPHIQIQSPSLLKTSLLLWDQVEFLVPYDGYRPSYADAEVAEAVELVGVHRCPTEEEKKDAHVKLEEFVSRDLPSVFYYRSLPGQSEAYEIYPQKLLGDTWQMLEKAQLTGSPLANSDYPATDATGLTIMSMLADSCAGETRSRITDRGQAYATITNLLVDETKPARGTYESVVPLTLKTMDISDLPLRRLIEFRKRETNPGGHELRALRHRYVERIEDQVTAIRAAKTVGDYGELQRRFEEDMGADLKGLRDELGFAAKELAFSKDVIVTVLAGVAAYAGLAFGLHLAIPTALTLAGTPVGVGGVLGTLNKFQASRRATMQKHPMAYIYKLEQHAR